MKGIVFLKPFEFCLEAVGEKWHQGDKIKASLKIKNHSTEKLELPILKVALCEASYKKIKVKNSSGWTIIFDNILSERIVINPLEIKEYSFEFSLADNCRITDKFGSLYLVFFDNEGEIPAGHIELVIEPKLVIQQILQILENFLRFKVKEIKNSKGMIEVKLIPPASRELSNLDGLLLSISEIEKNLTLNYFFNLRVLNLSASTMQSEKMIKEIKQVFNSREYLIYGDSINQDFIIERVQEILNGVKTKLL